MRLNICCIVFTLIGCPMSLVAQQMPTLRGTVLPDENPPPKLWGGVRIRVKNRSNDNKEVPGEQKITDNHDWYHVAPLGAWVDVWFDKACYVPGVLDKIYVKKGDQRLDETVVLQKALGCSTAEQHQRQSGENRSSSQSGQMARANSQRATAEPTLARGEDVAAVGFPARKTGGGRFASPPTNTNEFMQIGAANTYSLPSPRTLIKDLEKEARLARSGQLFDTFQYNFRVKWVVYGSVPGLAKTLWQFQSDKQNEDLFKQIGNVPLGAFDDTVRAQFEIAGPVKFENIKRVVMDSAMSSSVRGSATVAFLNIKSTLPETAINEMIEYYRQQAQDPSSEIFVESVVALARHGDSSDRAKLLDDIRNGTDSKRTIASIKALAVAQIFEGPEPLAGAAETLAEVTKENKDSNVRAAAVSALRPFAYRRDETAIKALVTGVREDSSDEVRARATLSLGAGNLEDDPWVRRILRSALKTDPSPLVRRAASATLSGARWFSDLLIF